MNIFKMHRAINVKYNTSKLYKSVNSSFAFSTKKVFMCTTKNG